MRIGDFMSSITSVASPGWAEDWDNCGVTVRSRSGEIGKVAVALDPTLESVMMAHSKGCDCLLTHHPLIFSPIRAVSPNDPVGSALMELIARDMSTICCHTNWDSSPYGTNVSLSQSIGLTDISPLVLGIGDKWGDGAVGNIPPVPVVDLVELIKKRWNLSFVRVWGTPIDITRVALCGGSGASLWKKAFASGAQVYITADLKYHDVQDALFSGLSVIQVDHGEMEWATMADLADNVSKASGLETVLLPMPEVSGLIF
nr:Nif3-like dinuclear metal center hexameric protein [uncultured Dethiosulfovibrio sp.]